MKPLIETRADARRRQVEVEYFNFSELTAFKAIVESAVELRLPVMVGVSEGEREFIGVAESAALVKTAHRVAARSRGGFQNHLAQARPPTPQPRLTPAGGARSVPA